MCSKLFRAQVGNALLPGDSTERYADFSKERPPIHLPYPTASPAPYTSVSRKQCLIDNIVFK